MDLAAAEDPHLLVAPTPPLPAGCSPIFPVSFLPRRLDSAQNPQNRAERINLFRKRTPKAQPSRRADSQSLYPRVLVIGTPSRRRPQWGSGRRSSCSHLPPAKMTAGGAAALRRVGRGRLRRRRRGRSLRQRAARGKSRAERAARGEAAAAARNPRLRTR